MIFRTNKDGEFINIIKELNSLPKVSDDVITAFDKLSKQNHTNCENFQALAESVGYTDEKFIHFLSTTDASERTLENYQRYLKANNDAAKKFSASLKALAANMAIMLAVNLAIKAATALWDHFNVTVEEQREKVDKIKESYEKLNTELTELKAKENLSDVEKERIEYLEKRIDLEKRLLEAETRRFYVEQQGNKWNITDWFDQDNYFSKMRKEFGGLVAGGGHWYDGLLFGYTDIDNMFNGYQAVTNDAEKALNRISDLKSLYDSLDEIQKDYEEGSYGWASYEKDKIDNLIAQEKALENLDDHYEKLLLKQDEYLSATEELKAALDSGYLTGEYKENAQYQYDTFKSKLDYITNLINAIAIAKNDFSMYQGDFSTFYESKNKDIVKEITGVDEAVAKTHNIDRYFNTLKMLVDAEDQLGMSSEEDLNILKKAIKDLDGTGTDYTLDDVINHFKELKGEINDTAEAANNLNKLSVAETVDALNKQLKPAFSNLKSAYQEIFTLDDNGNEIINEHVTLSALESVRSALEAFNELEGVGDLDIDEIFDDFATSLTGAGASAELAHEKFDQIATSLINTSALVDIGQNVDVLRESLESLGVTNADEVLSNLALAQEELKRSGLDLENIEWADAAAILATGQASEIATNYLMNYMIQKMLADKPGSAQEEIKQLEYLCGALDTTSELYKECVNLKNLLWDVSSGHAALTPEKWNETQKKIAESEKRIDDLRKQEYQVKWDFKYDGYNDEKNKLKKDAKSTADDIKNTAKDALDAMLAQLKIALEQGRISVKQYADDVKRLLDDAFANGTISGKEYWEYMEDMYQNQLSTMDRVNKAVQKSIEKRIKSLEKEKKQIEENYKSQIESIKSTIEKLRETNELRKEAISLQQKQYELERLQNQRTKLVKLCQAA